MRPFRASVLLVLAACGGQPAPPAVPASAGAKAPIVVVPLKVSYPGKAGRLEVTSDGRLLVDGRARARFEGSDVLDTEGRRLVHVATDGAVEVTPPEGGPPSDVVPGRARFDAHDELVADGGGRVRVGDDGTVSYAAAGGSMEKVPLVIEGFTPAARREVALIVVLLTLPARLPAPP